MNQTQTDYSVPKDEDFYVLTFPSKKSTTRKSLREVHVFLKSKKIFVPIMLFGMSAYLCATHDGIQMYTERDNPEVFVSLDWIIDEGIGGNECKEAATKLKNRVNKEVMCRLSLE